MSMMKRISVNDVNGVWIPSRQNASAPQPLIILLHGYGADMMDLASLSSYLPQNCHVVCFQGPSTTPFGGRSWFDINYLPNGDLEFDEQQALTAGKRIAATINQFIAKQAGDFTQVILGGFSQGAGVTQLISLLMPDQLNAALLMSGRSPAQVRQLIEDPQALSHLSVFVGHGTEDVVLPIENGHTLRDFWTTLPVKLTYHEYAMGHEINLDELRDINDWLKPIMNAS